MPMFHEKPDSAGFSIETISNVYIRITLVEVDEAHHAPAKT